MVKKKAKAGTSKASATERKSLWVEAMITNGGNATQAAVTAGYTPGAGAEKAGHRMSKDVRVKEMLAKRRAEVLETAQVGSDLTVRSVLEELRRLVLSDPRRFFKEDGSMKAPHELDAVDASALASLEVDELYSGSGKDRVQIGWTKKVKFWDKGQAIERAMKHLGLFEKDNAQKPATQVHLPGVKSVKFEPLRARGR